MRLAKLVCTYLLGLVFLVFGLNFFLNFIPMPKMEGLPAEFFSIFAAHSKWMLVIKVLEIAGGAAMLLGMWRNVALVILTAISFNIICYEALIMMQPGLGILPFAICLFLIWANRSEYGNMFNQKS